MSGKYGSFVYFMEKLNPTNNPLREAFEEWFGSQGLWRAHSFAKSKNDKGEYEDPMAEREWKKWQEKNANG